MKIYDTEVAFLRRSQAAAGFPKTNGRIPSVPKSLRKLAHAPVGSGHDTFLRGIRVAFKIQYTSIFSMQAERYTFLDIVSSQSKMHCLAKLGFQYSGYTDKRVIDIAEELREDYLADPTPVKLWRMLDSCPHGVLLCMEINTNYMQLKTIYNQREHHRYYGWKVFTEWVETLPDSHLITGKEKECVVYPTTILDEANLVDSKPEPFTQGSCDVCRENFYHKGSGNRSECCVCGKAICDKCVRVIAGSDGSMDYCLYCYDEYRE